MQVKMGQMQQLMKVPAVWWNRNWSAVVCSLVMLEQVLLVDSKCGWLLHHCLMVSAKRCNVETRGDRERFSEVSPKKSYLNEREAVIVWKLASTELGPHHLSSRPEPGGEVVSVFLDFFQSATCSVYMEATAASLLGWIKGLLCTGSSYIKYK